MKESPRQFANDRLAIDAGHREILRLMRAFATRVRHRGPSEHLLRLALRGLSHHAQAHFPEEEQLMQAAGVDARHVSKHRMEHRSFRYDIDRFIAQMEVVTCEGVAQVTGQLMHLLSSWLVHHLVGTDESMAAQIAEIRRGVSSEVAFQFHEARRRGVGTAGRSADSESAVAPDSSARCRELAVKLETMSMDSKARAQSAA